MSKTYAVGFSIGSKGYIGTGYNSDFWEWDLATNSWSQKATLPVAASREYGVGFSIGSKGYIGTGATVDSYGNPIDLNDFWEWDQTTNIWIQKANVPGSTRAQAVGFSIGSKGYISGGDTQNDFWEWDQATNTWAQKANFPVSGARASAVGFSIGAKGYIGTGYRPNTNTVFSDFWEWDQATNIWTQKANFGGGIREAATGFSIGSYGFLGTGNYYFSSSLVLSQDWWRYDPCNDTWTKVVDFGGGVREDAVGFSIGCKGYVGTGDLGTSGIMPNDFWEYDPALANIPVMADASPATLCYGQTATLTASCGIRYLWSTGATNNPLVVTPTVTTTYSVFVIKDPCDSNAAVVTVTVDPITNSFSNIINVDCFGNSNGSAMANVSGGIPSYTYLWNSVPVQTTQTASGLHAGPYVVAVTDSLGCSTADTISITSPTGLTVSSPVVGNVNCFGASTGTATVTATGGTPGYSYSWNPTNQTVSTATALAAGMYTVTITDNNGCIIKTFVPVTQPATAVTAIISADTSICPGTNATDIVTASGGTPAYTYLWMNTGETTTSVFIAPSVTTTYTAQITDANGCFTQLLTTVTVVPNPAATLSYTSDLCSGLIQFTDSSTNANLWNWNFGDGNTSAVQNPSHVYSSPGSYSVTLTLSGQLNCKTTDSLMVDAPPFSQLYIPNAFSPNDDGRDDIYYVFGKCISEMTFKVYDRWGEKVFETTDPKTGWDGTYKGQMENAGVFMYDLNGTLTTGEKINQKGNITLMR